MKNQICVTAQLLIRKPVEQVFQAFIDPAITVHFCLPKAPENWKLAKQLFGNGKCML